MSHFIVDPQSQKKQGFLKKQGVKQYMGLIKNKLRSDEIGNIKYKIGRMKQQHIFWQGYTRILWRPSNPFYDRLKANRINPIYHYKWKHSGCLASIEQF